VSSATEVGARTRRSLNNRLDEPRCGWARPSGGGVTGRVVFFGLLFLEIEFVALELELVVLVVEVLLFLAFADLDFDLAGFEFVVAEA
jgi:hypothetical protein